MTLYLQSCRSYRIGLTRWQAYRRTKRTGGWDWCSLSALPPIVAGGPPWGAGCLLRTLAALLSRCAVIPEFRLWNCRVIPSAVTGNGVLNTYWTSLIVRGKVQW